MQTILIATRCRRDGQKTASRGAKNAKKRAAVAVASKLSVLLHRLWVTGELYDPLHNTIGAKSERRLLKERGHGAQPGTEEVKVAPESVEATPRWLMPTAFVARDSASDLLCRRVRE